jgi:hypothetical protein
MTLFGTMRRHKAAIARALLPLLAVVWGSALASPCFGMSVEALDTPASEIPKQAHHHDTSAHATHDHDVTHASALAAHDHDVTKTDREHAPSEQGPSCPHCPDGSTHEAAGAHVACSALDDVADAGGRLGVAKVLLDYVAQIATPAVFAEIPHVLSPSLPTRTSPPAACGVSLHLRHCVFLI